MAIETVADPYEQNVTRSSLNPIPIKAIVTDLNFSKIQWSMPGIVADIGKEILIQKKYENLLTYSYSIEIDSVDYYGYRINGKLQLRHEGDYIRVYIYNKKES